MVLMLLASMPLAGATDGRAVPDCASAELSDVAGAMAVDAGFLRLNA